MISDYEIEWNPFVYGPPIDGTVAHWQRDEVATWAAAWLVVTTFRRGIGELCWNGTTFIPLQQMNLPLAPTTNRPAGVFAGTAPDGRTWNFFHIPWSKWDQRYFTLRYYADRGSGVSFQTPVHQERMMNRGTIGPKTPNPLGVQVTSDFGGPDALRVVDAAGMPIASVVVTAIAAVYGGAQYRATTQTTAAGRWAFPVVLEQNTDHRITFAKPGYEFPPSLITTGAAS